MATTYTLISSNVLTGSAASVTFSSIPSTYTDLVLRISARSTYVSATQEQLWFRITGILNNWSGTYLLGNGSAASSGREDRTDSLYKGNYISASGSTANTFGSTEIYIPNYAGSTYKPVSVFSVAETNATAINLGVNAGLWSNTTAMTGFTIITGFGDWASGSSFYLYGIKNS